MGRMNRGKGKVPGFCTGGKWGSKGKKAGNWVVPLAADRGGRISIGSSTMIDSWIAV